MRVEKALDIHRMLTSVLKRVPFPHVDPAYIVCVRSFDAKSRARARIWSFPKIWQFALDLPPRYIIEVLSQPFDHLSAEDKTRVIIHELMHIPKNFSGALVPHRSRHRRIDRRTVEKLFSIYKDSNKKGDL